MKRYSTNAKKTRWDGKEVYKSTVYPAINKSSSDLLITAGEMDSLDTLAFKYYNDPTLWWIIASVNNIGKGRLSVETGLQIRIPTNIVEIVNTFRALNT